MAILTKNNELFLRHPRTASNSIMNALLEKGATQVGPGHARFSDLDIVVRVLKPMAFCVIRNPLDVLASWYALGHMKDVDQFINEYRHSEMVKDNQLFYHYDACERIYVYENLYILEDEFNIKLKRTEPTPNKKPYAEVFNVGQQEFLINKYEKDYLRWEHHVIHPTTS